MYSDKGSLISEEPVSSGFATAQGRTPVFHQWKDWEPATLGHHDEGCCESARTWLTAMDFSALAGASVMTGPRWLSQRFQWGPSTYPVHWCEAVERKTLDCGVLAAMAQTSFVSRGVPSYRVQLIQRFSSEATKQWHSSWSADDADTNWLGDQMIYHEGCAVGEPEGPIRIWDASAAWWIDPVQGDGYSSVIAIRVNSESPMNFTWGDRPVESNVWIALSAD